MTYLGTVDSGLVHTLHDSRASTERTEKVEHKRLVPAVSLLTSEMVLVVLGEHINVLKGPSLVVDLSDQCSFSELLAVLSKTALVDKGVDIGYELFAGHALERIAKKSCGRGPAASVVIHLLIVGVVAARVPATGGDIVLERSLVVNTWRRHDEVL